MAVKKYDRKALEDSQQQIQLKTDFLLSEKDEVKIAENRNIQANIKDNSVATLYKKTTTNQ